MDAAEQSAVDLGCGPRKTPGSLGVDYHSYPGVDLVANLDIMPWPLESSRFEHIICRHIIEHVSDCVTFMSEVHRIGKHGAVVRVVTPHFSSANSWQDPTHRRHLSMFWYELFLKTGYLKDRSGEFKFVSFDLHFSSSFRSRIGQLIFRACGVRRWEKHMAFRWPAKDMETILRVVKPPPDRK